MGVIKEFLPLLIPLFVAQLALLGITLYHILTHKSYKHGNRVLWLAVTIVCSNFVGPILYWVLGRDDAAAPDGDLEDEGNGGEN